ncbi:MULTISPECIES: folylpolyglutamate synthase/dihydrofolate synthase family protein [unclassified Meiothermus]|uniref:bifunctional folylpolyglutamate synthase/dihydrofolate synthase n=1 Tax=unclassified Meiothermus TaxID=370471 RepID=UPI000D7C449B|nr:MULTISPECIES: folylpolyglutamate synthase/dihydrofolate synthase family protein [unclassified Meiothermus]PZA05901.1 bifunctional folylpolyglutamate synthase/dihydrofolate synthase [Meiothermus sp. Pnk-1]RYM32019.1 bifunctional folylpolyglutamate synthase/dihydrofolate synthase [Meiothermus sp. PNK-Is4]
MTDSLRWLLAQQRFTKPGLERIRALLEGLRHPEGTYRSVLVGGTNGKGSTTQALSSILRSAGYTVATYTSPHLVRFGERIVVDEAEISDDELEALLDELRPLAEEVEASFFEIVTAMALLHFARQRVDWAVLEVGLGGRFDATNAVEPELSLITSIGLDHTEILGPTPSHIAREKAGIMRPGKPVLTGAEGEGLEVLKACAAEVGAELQVLGEDFAIREVRPQEAGLAFTLELEGESHLLHTPLLGPHQARNLALAAAAARRLGVGREAIRTGLKRVRHPGRLERMGNILLDGAHNPEGAWALRQALKAHFPDKPLVLVLALSKDKDAPAIAQALHDLGPVVLTRYASPRARPPAELLPHFPGAQIAEDPLSALQTALCMIPRDGLVVVAGSLYLIGEIKRRLQGLEPEERWQ